MLKVTQMRHREGNNLDLWKRSLKDNDEIEHQRPVVKGRYINSIDR